MVNACFVIDPKGEVNCGLAYTKFDVWCQERGRLDLKRSITNREFGKRLRKVKGLNQLETRESHGVPRVYLGLRPKSGVNSKTRDERIAPLKPRSPA